MQHIPFLNDVLAFLKTVMPWVTGGLGGALVGYALNRRIARKREARLVISRNLVQFSIAGNSAFRDKLSVSYDGRPYESLTLCECQISNPSARTIEDVVVVFEFDQEATLVDAPTVEFTPIPSRHIISTDDLPNNMLRCAFGTLNRDSRARFRALVNGPARLQVHASAKDDPDLVHLDGTDSDESPERLVVSLGAYLALFVLVGSLPLAGGALQAVVILAAVPAIRKVLRAIRNIPRGGSMDNANVYIEHQVVGASAIGVALSNRNVASGPALTSGSRSDTRAVPIRRDPA
jgi:hypothetical protein